MFSGGKLARVEGRILSRVMKESVSGGFGAWKNTFISVNLEQVNHSLAPKFYLRPILYILGTKDNLTFLKAYALKSKDESPARAFAESSRAISARNNLYTEEMLHQAPVTQSWGLQLS